ncbi:MAG: hypothetical protein IKR13_04260, partial [Victivallales bacterium]|nr:hypothetical protein [Victivallales bacterium]
PYLDVPLQHIADPILKSMRRGMTAKQTRELLLSIRTKWPQMVIRTTFMTGYPGETAEDFDELLDFVKEMKFDRLGAFAFSPEPGTPAFDIQDGGVPAEVAEDRRKRLLDTQKAISLKRNKAWLGKTMRVLVEERVKKSVWVARGIADAPEVDPAVIIHVANDRLLQPNRFAQVQVTHAGEYDLTTQLLQ